MDASAMNEFFYENYYDEEKLVEWIIFDDYSPLGMFYLYFPPYHKNFKYFIGTVKNRINKDTIIACIIYDDKCNFIDKNNIFTCIETLEINYFYKGLGLLNILLKEFVKIIDKKNNIIVTNESKMGKLCHVKDHLKKTLEKFDFQKKFYSDDELDEKVLRKLK